MKNKLYVHYGANHFDRFKVNCHGFRIYNNKPKQAFWGSPVGSKNGWKDWCLAEDFHTESLDRHFCFRLQNGAKILHVYDFNQVRDYIRERVDKDGFKWYYLDFTGIMKKYDGLELAMSGENYSKFHYNRLFYQWDVESIVIWNPGIVVECDDTGKRI